MLLSQQLRKFALSAHVACSVSALGAVAAFLALAVAGLSSEDLRTVRALYPAMDLIARLVVLPLVVAALLTGLVSSLGTRWGLFRHFWVMVKLVLTVLVILVLLLQLAPIGFLAGAAADGMSAADHLDLRRSMVAHAAGGLLVLLTTTTLGIYKPRGMTRYGWRKQHEEESARSTRLGGNRTGPDGNPSSERGLRRTE